MDYQVYMHGQILGTHSFLLKGEFLQPDEYSEIKAKYFLPGGETGTGATVLASLGASVKMDGTHIGTQVAPLIKDFYKAGCIYGLLQGMSDDEIVRFASACSAIAISRFPLPLNPPTMEEVQAMLNRKNIITIE